MSIISTSDLVVADRTTVDLDDKNGNELLDAAGQTRRSITIYGPGSRQFAEAQAKHNARGMKRLRTRGGRLSANADEEIGAKASFLADITISFNGFGLTEDQQTREAFREFYANTGVGYLTDQVNSAAGDWANF